VNIGEVEGDFTARISDVVCGSSAGQILKESCEVIAAVEYVEGEVTVMLRIGTNLGKHHQQECRKDMSFHEL